MGGEPAGGNYRPLLSVGEQALKLKTKHRRPKDISPNIHQTGIDDIGEVPRKMGSLNIESEFMRQVERQNSAAPCDHIDEIVGHWTATISFPGDDD